MLFFTNFANNVEYVLHIAKYLIAHVFIHLTCMRFAESSIAEITYNITIARNISTVTSYLEEHVSICIKDYYRDDIRSKIEAFFFGYSDTLTQDDIVQNQYSLLPYPAVSQESLTTEQYYYTSNRGNEPLRVVFSYILENINHFLFKGNNDFR